MKFYRVLGATFYDCIITIYQFIKPLLNNKTTIFQENGDFKPHFYIVKLGFTGYTLFFLISTQKHRLWGTR